MSSTEKVAADWFQAACQSFLENHQGCPCCNHQHCVIRSEWNTRIEFYCTECDFSVAWDYRLERFLLTLGQADYQPPAIVLTQIDIESQRLY